MKKGDVPILYEDDNYLIINKPAGLMVHADGRKLAAGAVVDKKTGAKPQETLVDWLLKFRPEIRGVGESIIVKMNDPETGGTSDDFAELAELSKDSADDSDDVAANIIERPGIVHRLDRDTSGVLVVAKTPEAFLELKDKFKNRDMQKMYHAVVRGRMKEDDGIIDRQIGRSPVDFRQRLAGRGARGELREAITRWTVMARGTDATLLEVIPKTGRTHQIRVHFKSVHHPILGDSLYDKKHIDDAKVKGIKRLSLHAYSLSFIGIDGKRITAVAPYPEDFAAVVERVKAGKL